MTFCQLSKTDPSNDGKINFAALRDRFKKSKHGKKGDWRRKTEISNGFAFPCAFSRPTLSVPPW